MKLRISRILNSLENCACLPSAKVSAEYSIQTLRNTHPKNVIYITATVGVNQSTSNTFHYHITAVLNKENLLKFRSVAREPRRSINTNQENVSGHFDPAFPVPTL